MVRLRKTKGPSSDQGRSTQSSKLSNKKFSLKEQVLALGGDEDDCNLVKNVPDDLSNSGPSNEDPALSKDVSKFLNSLTLSGKRHGPANNVKPHPSETKRLDKKMKKSQIQKSEPTPEIPKPTVPSKHSTTPKSHFVMQPTAHWYTSAPSLGSSPTQPTEINSAQLASLTSRAASLHSADIQTFQTSSSSNTSSSEASFLQKILQSGTLSDRLSALTLLVQSSPGHNTKALETLKGMAERGKGKGGREESLKALRCVVDWWVGGGAPDRKLKYFRDQPLLHPSTTDHHLLVWYFEDWLKKYFFSILQVLETLSLDPLVYVRTQALTLIFTLIRDKPEQEQNLLRLLVNKLGDMEKSICSRSSYHLLQLLQSHPSMKAVIVREIISLVLRPSTPATVSANALPSGPGKHVRFADSDTKAKPKPDAKKGGGNPHARYYATITFNQIVLAPRDRDVALQLINVYFEMFKELLGEKIENSGDGEDRGEGAEHKKGNNVDKEGRVRVRDGAKGKGRSKGKMLEIKGAAGFTEVEDAHSRLISAILTGVNRALPFAKIDAGDTRLNAHIDTLFLITHTSTFNISLQALVLIQQIAFSLSSPSTSVTDGSLSTSIINRYYRTLYSSLHDSRLATSSKQAMYLNLLFKSIKTDPDTSGERVKAFVRRFVQVLVGGGGGATEFVAGGLFLLGELFAAIPDLKGMLTGNGSDENQSAKEDYDPRKRDPQFSHASSSPLWELIPLLHHYHPAISLHARQLLSSEPLTASADLSLNTLSHFLDRFVYKNPKHRKANASGTMDAGKGKGSSAMQPAASALDGTGVKLMKGEAGAGQGQVNDSEFLRKRLEDVPVDQIFFYKFFTRKNEREKAKAAKVDKQKHRGEESESKDDGDEDVSEDGENAEEVDENSDEDEAEIWEAMKATMPKLIGDEDLMEESDELSANDADDSEDENDELSLVEGSDNADLISLDGDVPEGLMEYDGPESSEEDEWGGIGTGEDKKRKRTSVEETKSWRRKKLRSLPTFASYEGYAKMIEDAPEDDI